MVRVGEVRGGFHNFQDVFSLGDPPRRSGRPGKSLAEVRSRYVIFISIFEWLSAMFQGTHSYQAREKA